MHQRESAIIPRMAALLLAIMTSACASIDAFPPKLQAIRTVGIISAVGDEFTLTNAGLTGFDNGDRVFPIEAWGLDDFIVSHTGGMVSRRLEVQAVTYSRAAFAAIERDTSNSVADVLREDPIKKLVRTEVSPQGLDAYVVITKAISRYGSRGKAVAGVGMIIHDDVFDSYRQIHALYVITIIDGHDFSVIDKRSAEPLNNTEIVRLAGPSHVIDDALQPPENGALPSDKLKAAVIDLIESSLFRTLQDLRLADRS